MSSSKDLFIVSAYRRLDPELECEVFEFLFSGSYVVSATKLYARRYGEAKWSLLYPKSFPKDQVIVARNKIMAHLSSLT